MTEGNRAAETGERLETALRAQKRRVVAALVETDPIDATPILRPTERLDCEAYVTLCYELHHVHLHALARAGVVRFDRHADVVTRGERFGDLAAFGGDLDPLDDLEPLLDLETGP